MAKPNLALAGFMGAGKTTVGIMAARLLDMPFVDTDAMVEADTGFSVQEIFSRYGEEAFRDLERQACKRVAAQGGNVIALGGGALLDRTSRAALERSSVLVLLTCEQPALFKRLEASVMRGERPLLVGDFRQKARDLMAAREAIYNTIPLKVDTTNLMPEEVARELADLYTFHTASSVKAEL